MSAWLYAALVLAAGAVCPLHVWWQHWRGRRAACCPPRTPQLDLSDGSDLAALRRRQLKLSAQIAELDAQRSHPLGSR